METNKLPDSFNGIAFSYWKEPWDGVVRYLTKVRESTFEIMDRFKVRNKKNKTYLFIKKNVDNLLKEGFGIWNYFCHHLNKWDKYYELNQDDEIYQKVRKNWKAMKMAIDVIQVYLSVKDENYQPDQGFLMENSDIELLLTLRPSNKPNAFWTINIMNFKRNGQKVTKVAKK